MQKNKDDDNDWFRLESNKEGTRWFGKCWYIYELLKYEFDIEFDVSTSIGIYLNYSYMKFADIFLMYTYINILFIWNVSISSIRLKKQLTNPETLLKVIIHIILWQCRNLRHFRTRHDATSLEIFLKQCF